MLALLLWLVVSFAGAFVIGWLLNGFEQLDRGGDGRDGDGT